MMKSEFRTSAYDAPERPKPAELPPTRIPIIDARGSERGHVHGLGASAATIARFGIRNARLKKINGVLSWAGEASANTLRRQEINRAQRVKANKGSVSFKPTKPDKAVRPERGG
jgi:hypothetical protein